MLLNIIKAKAEPDKEIYFDVKFDLQDEVLNDRNYKFLTPAQLAGTMKYKNEELLISAKAGLKIQAICDNCGEGYEKDLKLDFDEVFIESFNSHSAEDYLINQTYVDLAKPLADDLILNLPTKMLCKPKCKGLCPHCGKNKNRTTCNCNVLMDEIEKLESPFNKLKK